MDRVPKLANLKRHKITKFYLSINCWVDYLKQAKDGHSRSAPDERLSQRSLRDFE